MNSKLPDVNIKNLENLAYHNAPLPKDLDLPEQLFFLSLRCVYGSFRHKQIDEATAKMEKNQLTCSYEQLSYHILQNKNGCEMCKKAVAIFTNMDREKVKP